MTHYNNEDGEKLIINALAGVFRTLKEKPLFICIGTGRHILDCLGPLTGTMLSQSAPDLMVYGTLEKPLHARNLSQELNTIKSRHAGTIEVAVDAAVGEKTDIGVISIRQGPLKPGRAFYKNLPAVGHLSITGVVDSRENQRTKCGDSGAGLVHVYHMANLLSKAISKWHKERQNYDSAQ
jgi:putative sporulation protein YyaC